MQPCHEINLTKNAGKVDTYNLALGFSIDDWLLKGGGWGHVGGVRCTYMYKYTDAFEIRETLITIVIALNISISSLVEKYEGKIFDDRR